MLHCLKKFSGSWLRRATHVYQNAPIVQNDIDLNQSKQKKKQKNSVVRKEEKRNTDFDLICKLLRLNDTEKTPQSSLSVARVLSNDSSTTSSFHKWWLISAKKSDGFRRNFHEDPSWWVGLFATYASITWHRYFANKKREEDLCPYKYSLILHTILTKPQLRVPICNAVNSEKSALSSSVTLDTVKSEASSIRTDITEDKLLENFDKSAARFEQVSDECYGVLLFQQASEYRENNNLEKAFQYFHTAVQYDHLPSMYHLGLCYENGQGVKASLKKAAELYKQATEKGHLKSMFSFANLHYNFHGSVSDINKDIGYQYMKKAADGGLVEAQLFLALMFANENKVSEAFNYFEKAAKQNDKTSIFNLAVCYENGFGVVKDISKAMEYYKQSGEMGDVSSQFYLGESYQHGLRGLKKDLKESLKWYNLAAENGHSEAAIISPLIGVKISKEKLKRKVQEKYVFSFMNLSQSLVEPKYNGNFHFSFDSKWLK